MLVIGLLVVIVGGGLVALRYLGAKPGEKCDSKSDCRGGLLCLNRRCREQCSSDGDCQSGWSCRGTSVLKTTSGAFSGQKIENDSVKLCFSPEAMARSPERANEVREKQHQAELDEILKHQDVRNAVLLKTMVLPGKPPPVKVSDEAFEAAWSAIPEATRRTGATPALAAQVIDRVAAQQRAAGSAGPPQP